MEKTEKNRPLSPHLTIYRPQYTSVLSILHRITGVGLSFSAMLVCLWFLSASMGINYFAPYKKLMLSFPIQIIFVLSVWGIWFHTCTGVRHLIWDFGYGLDTRWIKLSAWAVLSVSLCLSIFTIYIGWRV